MAETTEGPGFGVRFAFARWLYHGRKGVEPGQTAIGKAVSRSQPTVAEWYGRDEAPKDYQVHKPLAEFLGVEKDWLVEGEGAPPEPALWSWFLSQRGLGGGVDSLTTPEQRKALEDAKPGRRPSKSA